MLSLICDGFSTQEIAEKLFLSAHTVDGHRRNLMDKTGMKNTASLVKFAITQNIMKS
ncbi:MAG: response regulator transcription factor [Bacteroidales bacterium]|nr:response regulator transcription factor [Bacteroidales bacterium]